MRAAILGLGLLLALPLLPLAAAVAEPGGGQRLALVVGEYGYPQARLPTADADAGLMASALAAAGFDVTALANPDASALRAAVAAFAGRARTAGPDAALVVYVNGYGLQYRGENWLVPAGARIGRDDAVPKAGVRLAELTAPLEKLAASLRLFVFDLARPTPFAHEGLSLASGLALTEAPVGSVYAFNAAPGTVGLADVPPYGAYARALAEALQAPGLSPGTMLRRVRLRVAERTDGAVLPYDDGSSEPGFAFFPGPATAAALPSSGDASAAAAFSVAIARDTLPGYGEWLAAWPRDPLAGRVLAMAAWRRESLFWSEAVRVNTPRAYWTYQRRYPRGPHGGDARRQLFALNAALEPPPRFEIVPFEGLPPPTAAELATLGRSDPTFADADGPVIPMPSAALVPADRGAFFDTLPPPPIPLAGTLPVPLPVAAGAGEKRPFGRVEQPDAPGGPLVTTMRAGRDGPELVTSGAKDAAATRVFGTADHGRRTITEVTASGATISRVALGVGADGALSIVRTGPGGLVLDRWLTRDAGDGSRVTTMFDGGGQPVAVTTVSSAGIVTSSAAVPGRPAATFVLAATPNDKGEPVVFPAPEPRTAPSTDEPHREAMGASTADTPATKAPALPLASGLTGEVPRLDLPPAPKTPAFDAAAAPVAGPTAPAGSEPAGKPAEAAAPAPGKPAPEPNTPPPAKDGAASAGAAKPAAAMPGVEPAKPEPAKPEPAKPEPAKPEPAKPEPAKPELAKVEPPPLEATAGHGKPKSSTMPRDPPLPPPRQAIETRPRTRVGR